MWRVKSGDISLSKLSSDSGNSVKKIIIHEGYNEDTHDNDIALLRLNAPLTFGGNSLPVMCLVYVLLYLISSYLISLMMV